MKNINSLLKIRLCYGAAALFIIFIEVLIALFVHDGFIRPYLGDVLAVFAVYFLLRAFIPRKCRLLPLFVFLFALCVEFSQLFDLAAWPLLQNSRFLRILLGSVFDTADILCYAIGCALLGGYEILRYRIHIRKNARES